MSKTFDCVEAKRRAQERLRKEYEARKGEFVSYGEFLTRTAARSPDVRAFRARLGRSRAAQQK